MVEDQDASNMAFQALINSMHSLDIQVRAFTNMDYAVDWLISE